MVRQNCNYINWTRDFSIKNIDLDKQHEIIFSIANNTLATINEMEERADLEEYKKYQDEFKKITIQLFNYMKTHFVDEEKFMLDIGFPLFEEHRKAHINLTHQAKAMLNDVNNIELFSKDLKDLISNFIMKHFATQDILLANFVYKALHISEVHFNLEQYTMIKSILNQNIYTEQTYDYVCRCPTRNIHKIPQTIHEELENEDKLMKCSRCGNILVFVKEFDLKQDYKKLREKFQGVKNWRETKCPATYTI